MQVALLITCLTDNYYPRAGMAVVRVLEKLGCTVHFPEDQTCCGQPMWNNGFADESRALARGMIQQFGEYEYVVTPSGSCAAMIREYYAQMFQDEPDQQDRAQALGEKTFEFVEFLVKVLKVDLRKYHAKWSGKATYHYSCHLRSLGITDEAAELMGQIQGLEYLPLENADQCCGFGGTFAMKYPQISGAMARDKVNSIVATGAATVVSNEAGCTMNISGSCHRRNVPVNFKSLAEIIAESMGLMENQDTTQAQ